MMSSSRAPLLILSVSLLTGCHTSSNAPATTPHSQPMKSPYPARATVTAPPVKLFHKTADSLTLVTDQDASDDQIEALVWELRDAAHAHTLDKLGAGMSSVQAFVDHNQPTTWFHIYRGTRCAAEKYASGDPPCGGSYHAAADYTFGTPGNPDWDQGTLLHDEKETLLWDPDKPYTPSKP